MPCVLRFGGLFGRWWWLVVYFPGCAGVRPPFTLHPALRSLYVKQMRDQLMTELRMLFKSDCEGLIDFYGAVYREARGGAVAPVFPFRSHCCSSLPPPPRVNMGAHAIGMSRS